MLRYGVLGMAVVLAAVALTAPARAQQTGTMSDSDYVAKVMTAAPAAVVKGATIVEMQAGGTMRVLQTGTNGFTCLLLDPTTPMCADQNAVAWMRALMTHATPPDGVGFVYMLAGDDGASNTDPYATAQSSTNHWVKTGPHVMIVGASVKTMGYPMTVDPDPSKPYVMWPATPYAHIMIPVVVQP
ncbi:MAG: hypothetical protein WA814_04815 [Candidatus Baltobacteraceae bacterium]